MKRARLVALSIAALSSLSGCATNETSSDSENLSIAGHDSGVGWAIENMEVGASYLDLDTLRVCVGDGADVEIDSISFVESDGLEVGSFSVTSLDQARDSLMRYDDDPKTLEDIHLDPAENTVRSECPSSYAGDGSAIGGEWLLLAMEVEMHEGPVAGANQIRIEYTSSNVQQEKVFLGYFAFCQEMPQCHAWIEENVNY